MTLPRLTGATELLDAESHDPVELEHSLDHVAQVNRFLGGGRSLVRTVQQLGLRNPGILDVGTGSADLPRVLADTARKNGWSIQVTATDLHPQMIDIARKRSAGYPEITVSRADALALPFPDGSFDLATISLTLHHFDRPDQLRILRELRRVTRTAVIVSELERNYANLFGAKVLAATWWRKNRLTRHDGPLSVLRGFTVAELEELGRAAGFRHVVVRRHFFFRLIMVGALT